MMASIAGGTRVGRVCSVAFGLIARRVGRVTHIAMVGCASGRTRTIERDTKGAKTRFIAPAYGKFESSSLQRRVVRTPVQTSHVASRKSARGFVRSAATPFRVKRHRTRCDQRFQLKRILERDIVVELALEARPVRITSDEKHLEGRPRAARSYSVRSRQSGHHQIHEHQIPGFTPLKNGQGGPTAIGPVYGRVGSAERAETCRAATDRRYG